MPGSPIHCIREVREDGTDILVGSISIIRNSYFEIADEAEREKFVKQNEEKQVGDPSIVWSIGCTFPSCFYICLPQRHSMSVR